MRDDFSGFHPWLSSASPSLLPLLVAVLFLVGVDDDADDSVSGASSLGAIMVTVMIAFTHALLRLTGRGERRWIIIMQIERDYDDDASLSSPPYYLQHLSVALCRQKQGGRCGFSFFRLVPPTRKKREKRHTDDGVKRPSRVREGTRKKLKRSSTAMNISLS